MRPITFLLAVAVSTTATLAVMWGYFHDSVSIKKSNILYLDCVSVSDPSGFYPRAFGTAIEIKEKIDASYLYYIQFSYEEEKRTGLEDAFYNPDIFTITKESAERCE